MTNRMPSDHASAMEMAGLQISCAPTAEDALGLLRDVDFKLVFVDIGLPGVNGFELCKQGPRNSDGITKRRSSFSPAWPRSRIARFPP